MTFRVEAQDDGTVEVFDDAGGCWGLTREHALRVAELCERCAAHGLGVVEIGNVGPTVLRVENADAASLAAALRAAGRRT